MKTIFSTICAFCIAIGLTSAKSITNYVNADNTKCIEGAAMAHLDLLKLDESTFGWNDGLFFSIFEYLPSKAYTEDNAFMRGTFMGHGTVETYNICLLIGKSYVIQAPTVSNENEDEIGMTICEQKYLEPNNMIRIHMTTTGCKVVDITEKPSNKPINSPMNNENVLYNYVQSYNSINYISIPISSSYIHSLSYSANSMSQSRSYSMHQSIHHYSMDNSIHYSMHQSTSHSNSILTSQHTIDPSPSPSPIIEPSPSPIIDPSPSPIIDPSPSPITNPNIPPTFNPVNFPTPHPSLENQPSANPTTQNLPIAQFKVSIILSVTSNAPYDSQTELAICEATAITLSTDPEDCHYTGTIFAQTSRRELLNVKTLEFELLSTYAATSSINIIVQTANPNTFFSQASADLATAASSGSFTANLQSACQSLGVINAVSTATVTGASAFALVIILPPTFIPTPSPTNNNAESGTLSSGHLSVGDIIAATIMSAFGALLLFCGLYYYHRNYLQIIYDTRGQPSKIQNEVEMSNQYNEPFAETNIEIEPVSVEVVSNELVVENDKMIENDKHDINVADINIDVANEEYEMINTADPDNCITEK